MLVANKVKKEQHWKKSKKEYKQQNFFVSKYNNFSIKRVMRKFHDATTTKKKCKKSVLHVQSCYFLLIRFIVSLAILVAVAV